jgi:uncharacterized damage-inducible protein DinB
MSPEFVAELFRYNRWANGRMREAAMALPPEEFTRDLGNSFPSVRDTLVHMVGAEWIWLQRWRGVSPPALPAPAELPSAEAIATRWAEVERGQGDFIVSLRGSDLERRVAYTNTKGQPFTYLLRSMMLHVVNHSSYHRGQITTMLRQLGQRPVSTDLLLFYDDLNRAPSGRT